MESTRRQLINLLANSKENYISGQALSEYLNISRNAVWKHMNELKKDGYIIEGIPRKGYRIISFPDKISENTLKWGLRTKWMGNTIVHKTTTSSTQTIAHQLAQENAKHGTIVIADEQKQGKGRMNREWYSAKDKGIWMSLILRPSISPHLAPQLTLLTATVLADVIYKVTGEKPQIKWPNDILIKGKKVAGILTEMQAEQDQIQYVVIGVGLNILHDKADLPKDLQHKMSSIKLTTKTDIDITKFIQEILSTFESTYSLYLNDGFSEIKLKWESYGFRIGEPVFIKTLKREWRAVFHGIAADGALLVKNSDGMTEKLYSAEIDWFDERG
ncbi:biotin--[acetyl-CoA-carboxylase] ligase [Virgibacillus sp. MSJ-26]|uniref:biotin--[acetyl-CoA-carboxylase] ligase n=1 Tax=Virgibacillus sp. MSJ-26 TaxID=2841522 RepID=UPI001C116E7A|nr:biotin--[acetyl-CoA-carboxylase] ligase [Virgibacillus sp. MSJ-26]MBU5466610.1 biotin--[acetyl-CoA-carboxylase] ligase [Virgibacillus sp. MSJ-26]